MSIDIEKIVRDCGLPVQETPAGVYPNGVPYERWWAVSGDIDAETLAAFAAAIIEQCARAVTDYAMSHSFDENDRTMICGAEDAIRALKPPT